jgi:hypothetical protein
MEIAEMVRKWLEIAKAEFFVLTARFKAQRKFFMSIMIILGVLWAAYFAPLLVELVMDALIPLTQIRVLLQVMFPGFMRAVMLFLWMFLLLIPLSRALAEVKIGQWEILLANDVNTRDILVGTFLGKVPAYILYVLFLAPLLLAPFQLAFQVSFLGQLLIYTVLTLMMLTTIWLSNVVGVAIQAKLGDSLRGNDIAKAIAMLMGLITIVPVLGLQFFASQLSAILGMNVFLVFPFTWSADLVSWLAITFNGINLTASQIANFQSILQLDLLANGLLMTLFGVVCVGIGFLSAGGLFTYGIGVRTETIRTVRHENLILQGLYKISPSSFGLIIVTSLKTLFRKVQNLAKVAMALTLALILPVLVVLVYGQRYSLMLSSLLPVTSYGLAFMGVLIFSGTTFLESRNQLWIIKSAPCGASRFVKARIVIAFLIALPLSLIPAIEITVMMGLELFQFLGLFANNYFIVCGAALLGTGITALNPNYEDTKSPAHQKNMTIAMIICLFVTMGGPLLLSIITKRIIGVPFETIMASLGIVGEGVAQGIITTTSLLVIGGLLVLVGIRRLGRPDV